MKKLLLLVWLFTCIGLNVHAQAIAERSGAPADDRSIVVFPNPSAGILHITAGGFEGKTEMRVLNVIGNVVYRESLNENETRFSRTIDLSELTPGLYYLKIENGSRSEMRKVVIR